MFFAMIGFIVLLGLGAYFLFAAYGCFVFTMGFTGKFNPWSVVLLIIGVAILWLDIANAPFSLSFTAGVK